MDNRQQKNEVVSSDEWYTPKWLIDTLGPFDLDPCAPMNPPFEIAKETFNIETNGLLWDWGDRSKVVWLNPPYSSKLIRSFVEKLADHNNGIAIVVNRTDNLLFQEVIFPRAKSMIFMRHRVKFINPEGEARSPMFGSCLIAFGDECDRRLRESGIEGKYVKLN